MAEQDHGSARDHAPSVGGELPRANRGAEVPAAGAECPVLVGRVTAADIRRAMLARWTAQEWAIMWEVTPATGAHARQRYADAVMMSLWPSRGLEIHGVEIKVSRSDWKREARDPTKAEAVGAYCDRWWVHVAPKVIHDLSEVPPAWGVREFDGKAWRTVREAEKTAARALDRGFLASLLRRADGDRRNEIQRAADAMISEQRETINKRIEDGVANRCRPLENQVESLRRQMVEFEEASGLTLKAFASMSQAREVGRLVKWAMKTGVAARYGGVATFIERGQKLLSDLQSASAELDLPRDDEAAA